MYNPFTSIKLIPSYGIGHIIQWSIDPAFHISEPHQFIVEVSGTPDFSELLYTIKSGNSFSAIDDTNIKQSWTLDLYYRVRLIAHREEFLSQNLAFSGSKYTRYTYINAREIMRKELLRMRKYTGSPVWLLKRKIHGKQLEDNTVDPVSGVPLTDQSGDYGSHFKDGYYDPLAFYASFEDLHATRTQQPEGLGMLEIFQRNFRTIGFPIIETYDIIVEPINDERYFVKDRQPFYFPSTDLIVVQTLECQLIPNTDPVYKINV